MMRKFYCYTILFLLMVAGCTEDKFKQDAELYSLSVKVQFPDHYEDVNREGAELKLINVSNGLKSVQESDTKGDVTFENVPAGEYELVAMMKIAGDKAKELGDTLISDEDIINHKVVNLGASINSILIAGDRSIDSLELRASVPGDLLIKEVFYTGTRTPNNRVYQSDHFTELYNNSNKTIFADGLHIATVTGSNGVVNTFPTIFQEDKDHVYLDFVWKVPGSGNLNPIPPQGSFIIAQDGMRHKSDPNGNPNSIDLNQADYETYLIRDDQRDVNFAEVPNMVEVFASRPKTQDFIFHSAGPSVVIFRVKDVEKIETVTRTISDNVYEIMKIPTSWVEDAFESLAFSNSGEYKRIPPSLDAGFIYCNGQFNGESCRRKVDEVINGRLIFQDTNNSGEDFEVIPFPTPGTFD